MWERAELKKYAKEELRFSYWISFGVCLIGGIFSGASTVNSINNFVKNRSGNFSAEQMLYIFKLSMVLAAIVFIYRIFIGNHIYVGMKKFFISAPRGDRRFENLFSSFKKERYISTAKTMFLSQIITFLFSLLFIIPGIIKSYEYYMVPYIIADHPEMSGMDVLNYSKRMTHGHKFDIFILELSFLGWHLLGLLLCCIGGVFVTPYVEATFAQLYLTLKSYEPPVEMEGTGHAV